MFSFHSNRVPKAANIKTWNYFNIKTAFELTVSMYKIIKQFNKTYKDKLPNTFHFY